MENKQLTHRELYALMDADLTPEDLRTREGRRALQLCIVMGKLIGTDPALIQAWRRARGKIELAH
uniref:Uncharacterized protein n=1 Tax=viral metagenome TaxID=1070528 RepID=A0A6M3KUE1_9ZZZZ